MRPLSPAQRIHRWSVYLWAWRLHRWIGWSLGLLIILLSLTGGILVMHGEVERRLAPERHVVDVPGNPTRVPLLPVLQSLQAEAPSGFRLLRLEPGHDSDASDKIVFIGEDRKSRWSAFLDPYRGVILWRGHDQSLITPWLLHLHMHLQIGRWGYVLTGLGGVALMLLGFTGLWITRDRWRTLFRRPVRFDRGWRIAASDLHKWVGLATLYFTFVLGATGIWFAILILPGQFRPQAVKPLAPVFDLARLTAIEPAIARTLAEFPGSELARVIFPWNAGVGLQIRVLHRNAPVWAKTSHAEFDPITGKLVKIVRAADASTADKWQAILGPLHFGYYGSPLVKWLYVVGGFSPALLAFTGTAIWWVRRTKRAASH